MGNRVRVWDLPTRLFHWALALCMLALVVTGHRGGDAMQWHARFGYTVLTLLLFRIAWGFAGGHWSRFSSFVFSPARILAYVRGDGATRLAGHNPLGALSIFAMLAILIAQIATGLVGDDEIAFTGPLNRFVESAQALAATSYHKRVGDWLVVGLAALHIGAVLYHLFARKDNLIAPMLHGDKTVDWPAPSSRDDAASRLRALVVFAACAGGVAWLVKLGG